MKKNLLMVLILVPCLLSAQHRLTHADSLAMFKNKHKELRQRYALDSVAISKVLPQRPHNLVNDYTHTLSDRDKRSLENKLDALDAAKMAQLAIVIVPSVGKYDAMEYGFGLAQTWGIGQKRKNNGVLILVAINDHKAAILTGLGLENFITDAVCDKIIQNSLFPHFKNGDFFGGLDEGTYQLITLIKAHR